MIRNRKRVLYRAAILSIFAIVLLIASIKILEHLQKNEYKETRGTGTDEFMQAGIVEWDDHKYRKIPAVTTYLIGGIDKEDRDPGGVSTSNYRNGGQADFLLLMVIDNSNKKVHQLQIDRDTMTEITILSVYGRESGKRVQQICLAHNFGANKNENASYTVKAVRNMLNNIEIDGYYMVDYSSVSVLNDLLGGVHVTVPDDMTSVNPLWTQGAEITLRGKEAETFVRTRQTIGSGTNAERMGRQNEFMQNVIKQLRGRLSEDSGFGMKILTKLKKSAATNLSDQIILEELQKSAAYEVLPVEYLEGQYKISKDGFMEFHLKENTASDWIMRNLYKQVSD